MVEPRVAAAMASVARREFMPPELADLADMDDAFPIGAGQTISQPSLVARMSGLLALAPDDRVLEIGTGSGYQAAILARLAAKVYSVEIVPNLARTVADRLAGMGIANVFVRQGDGHGGWPEEAPYDAIIVTCAAPAVPVPLLAQLKLGGRMVVPVRAAHGQEDLMLVHKSASGWVIAGKVSLVSFVPMTGPHGIQK